MILLSCTGVLSGCLGAGRLQKNEYLLTDQYTVGNKGIQDEELAPYYLQPTNRKLLGLPFSLWIYEIGNLGFDSLRIEQDYHRIKRVYNKKLSAATKPNQYEKIKKQKNKRLSYYEDKLKHGNFIMQRGEKPVIYSSEKRLATENNLLHYLHTKGYFKAQVKSKLKIKKNTATVIYFIKKNEPSLLNTISLTCADETIKQLLEPYTQKSLLKKGQKYDQEQLITERERIYNKLQKKGYWNFYRQYIEFNVDTTTNHINLQTIISLPNQQKEHTIYHLDGIEFVIDSLPQEQSQDTTTQGITFYHTKQHFSPSTIMGKITLRPGQVYNKAEILETKKRLIDTGIFKNIQINQEAVDEKNLRTHIYTQLYDRFQLEQEIGAGITRNSPLPFYQIALISKNLLKQLETLSIRSQIGIEIGSFPTDGTQLQPIQNFQLSIGGNVQELVLPLTQAFRKKIDAYRPYTKADIGYTFTKQTNYNNQRLSAVINYGWSPWPNISFDCTPLKMNLIDFNLKEGFANELAARQTKGDHSYKRYQPALYTQTSLKTVFQKLNTDNVPPYTGAYHCLEHFIESGGTLQSLFKFEKIFGKEITNYQYLKSSITYTRHIPIQRETLFVYHIHTGFLYPYNMYKIAPPEQYYFIGGPSSIRAWGTRSLGPGSYQTKEQDEENKKFLDERPGELIIQTNLELRRQLTGIIGCTFFIDMGNIWTLQKTKRKGEEFSFNRFYKEIAIGVGTGLFLNFNIIVLRLDIGIKLYDPGMPIRARLFPANMFSPTINFTLGHPF
jgi:outer membrane protein insertion porin family